MRKSDYLSLALDLITVILIPGAFFACGLIAIINLIIN